ncbi:hypothetical protein [Actinoplanes sp. GCM10030250]|uniref:hypothetical protein n=1 Tax=Actinoplanes sp. GCM10030250 TaxID=3273376 RepID=UPI00360B87A4
MIPPDVLRPPAAGDPAAAAYKDWLHLNLFDHERDTVGLVNISIHGRPGSPETQVVTAALFDAGYGGWAGDITSASWAQAAVSLTGLSTRTSSIAMVGDTVVAGVTGDVTRVRVTAAPAVEAEQIPTTRAFGTGWIGWRLVPRMRADGWIDAGGTRHPGPFDAYHDHTWGRWHWGDDIGWEWGTFMAGPGSGSGAGVVLARTTTRSHRDAAPFTVVLDVDGERRRFGGARVRVVRGSAAPAPVCRLPGALAALHADRRRPRLPGTLSLTARSGDDLVELEFTCRAVAQLILADPVRAGYSFLHELSGHFAAQARVSGRTRSFEGLGIVEFLS